ncbi:acyl-CoA dehydrogenase family protein [Hoyosella sp. G463]|uniref:Acyl-CoA dehydrogenase family protein n=1 Tax=Lolliginicoccus lacisalsi TaxID=2742202 RepID=A0A927J9Z5_9ACTN|nr:acyl-CoA dehydrogenase family protein [Lolliginicoccus lacisalsi]MBD8505050.1 acyl-CoA dehydrogenase family protein [Lolliginicoccus lacisalsi]
MDCEPLLQHLLTAPATAPTRETTAEFWDRHCQIARRFPHPVDAAAAAGFGASCVGLAFGSGYQAALRVLDPGLGDGIAALCVTEAGGGHPRAVTTSIRPTGNGWVLNGTKTFVTFGPEASELLVAASAGASPEGRNSLRVVRVRADQPGVRVTARPPLPMVPELPHGEVQLEEVQLNEAHGADVLDGDGYTRYVKPFRTIEDIHATAAVLGWLLRIARESEWPRDIQEQLVATIVALRAISGGDPASPAVHIALAGALASAAHAIEKLEPLWADADPGVAAMWQRDKALLGIAGRARAARLDTAWATVNQAGG